MLLQYQISGGLSFGPGGATSSVQLCHNILRVLSLILW